MSKRFTDTDKWKKPWFRKLTPKNKVLWFYLLDICDNLGVFQVDIELASFMIGENITETDVDIFSEHIKKIDNNKYLIKDFVLFQYKKLKATCKPHMYVIDLIEKHDLKNEGFPIDFEILNKEIDRKARVAQGLSKG